MLGTPRIDDVLKALGGMDAADLAALDADGLAATEGMRWVPNPGPQTAAYFSEADELFYGGQAGGGKSDLGIGLAMNEHHRSLLLRRTNKEAAGIIERMVELAGDAGLNRSTGTMRLDNDGHIMDVGGCQLEEDKQKYKGTPHDLIFFDEVSDFTESQYLFITTWNRSTKPGQRCRVVAAGNPPTRPEGLWVIRRWAAWLDPKHPNPAKPGELRWYVRGETDEDVEVPGPGEYEVEWSATPVAARSRTFIPAELGDNPDLAATNYSATLDALPFELRAAYRDGRFDVGLQDNPMQAIPTDWVRLAQQRWMERPPPGMPMHSIGVDASGGGRDPMVLVPRHGVWFGMPVKIPGEKIPVERAGAIASGLVLAYRKDDAEIWIDMSGGYGISMYEHLYGNGLDPHAYKGAIAVTGKDRSGKFGFRNLRSKAIWAMREALDPERPGGSDVMLPPSPGLLADLTAPTYEVRESTIVVESKEAVCDRLKRSTDEGDAVVMAWYGGPKAENFRGGYEAGGRRGRTPQVVLTNPAPRGRRR